MGPPKTDGSWWRVLTKEARTYNGAKTAPLRSGAGKTGQLRVKE